MTTFFVISGVILWIIILWIIIMVAYSYYDQYLIKKAFKTVAKRNLDKLFKDAIAAKVKEDLGKNLWTGKTVLIKAGETVRIIPHDQFKREYKVLTKDYRFIEGVKPDKLEIKEEEK